MTQCIIDIDESLAGRLQAAGAVGETLEPGVRTLLDLALSRLDEAALLGLLEGRTSAVLEGLRDDVRYLEALIDRVLFFAVAAYALVRSPHDTREARRLFESGYEDARREAERRALRSPAEGRPAC